MSDKGFIIQSTSDIRNFDAVGHNAKKKNNFASIEDFKREGNLQKLNFWFKSILLKE